MSTELLLEIALLHIIFSQSLNSKFNRVINRSSSLSIQLFKHRQIITMGTHLKLKFILRR